MNFIEIKKLWQSTGRGEPQTAIQIYILGIILYETNEIEGEAACSLVLPQNVLIKDNKLPSGFRLNQIEKQNLEIFKKNPEIIRSYFKNEKDPNIFLRKKEVARARAKLLIKTNLKGSTIPIFLTKENYYWKIINGTSSILKMEEGPR